MTARTLYDKLWDDHVVHTEDDGTAVLGVLDAVIVLVVAGMQELALEVGGALTSNGQVVAGVQQAIDIAERQYKGVIIWQDKEENFSYGADLKYFSNEFSKFSCSVNMKYRIKYITDIRKKILAKALTNVGKEPKAQDSIFSIISTTLTE